MTQYRYVKLGGLEVCFTDELDGGGARYGQDFVSFVAENVGNRRRIFEWCAGPGFIGFSLLGHGLADTLCLADVNPAAIEACRETVRRNGLEDVVDVYRSDCLDQIPSTECWDLVVGNPPHSGTADIRSEINRPGIIYQDPDWRVHQRFYASIARFLLPDAQIIIQENNRFSSPGTFREMMAASGLRLLGTPLCGTPAGNTCYYYLWCARVPRRAERHCS